jgi:hypothetical protein
VKKSGGKLLRPLSLYPHFLKDLLRARKAAKEKGVEPAARFLETAMVALEEIGVPRTNIRHESYG